MVRVYTEKILRENKEIYEESKFEGIEEYTYAWELHIALLDMIESMNPRPCYVKSMRFCQDHEMTLEVELCYDDVSPEEEVTITFTMEDAKELFVRRNKDKS